uniref:mitogen-activated protein kinase kinase n=1 Tax=Acrobeloides nanus TaxID=290746 RepID=A0A914C3J7_9BILA
MVGPVYQLTKIKSIKGVNKLKFPRIEKKFEFKMDDLKAKGVIGTGQCTVRKYLHTPSQQILAIKFIHIPLSRFDDPASRQRFKRVKREIENSKMISKSPNIVDFYGFCVHDLQVLLCMEVMDRSLKDLFMRVHQLGLEFREDMIGYIAVSIIDAMVFCKSKGIIHRDIKPPNVLINNK